MYWTQLLLFSVAVCLIVPFVNTAGIRSRLSQSFAFQLLGLTETKPTANNNVRHNGNRRTLHRGTSSEPFNNQNIHSQGNGGPSLNGSGRSLGSLGDMSPPGRESGLLPSNTGNGQTLGNIGDMLPPGHKAGFHPSLGGNGQSLGSLGDMLPPGQETGLHVSGNGNGQSLGSLVDMLPPGLEARLRSSNNGNGQSLGSLGDMMPPGQEAGLHLSRNGNSQSLGSLGEILPRGLEARLHPSNTVNGQSLGNLADMLSPSHEASISGNEQSMRRLVDMLPPARDASSNPSLNGNSRSLENIADMLHPGHEAGLHPPNSGNAQSLGSIADLLHRAGEASLRTSNNGKSHGSQNGKPQNPAIAYRSKVRTRSNMRSRISKGQPASPTSTAGNIANGRGKIPTGDVTSGQGVHTKFGLSQTLSDFKYGLDHINPYPDQGRSRTVKMLPRGGSLHDMSFGPLQLQPSEQIPVMLHKGMRLGISPMFPNGGRVSMVDGNDISVVAGGVETSVDGADITHEIVAG